MRHEKTGDAVLDNIWNSPVCAADHRPGERHRFEKHEAETFTTARQGEDVATRIAGEELLGCQSAEKMRVFRNAQIARKFLKPWPIVPISDKYDSYIRRGLHNTLQRRDERIRAFVLLGGIPSADGQDDSAGLRKAWRT